MDYVLRLVGDNVFCLLNPTDLLNCSLVSKQWNHLSRGALRKNKICLLCLQSTRITSESLNELTNLLQSSSSLPYSGLSLCLETAFLCSENVDGKKQRSPLNDIMKALDAVSNEFTVLSLGIKCELDEITSAAVRQMLNMFCGTIEVLRVQTPVNSETIESIGLATITFPRLSDLQFGPENGPILMEGLVPYGQSGELLEKIVDNAPNLKRVDSYLTPEWCKLKLVENLEHRGLVVSFTCDFVRASPWDAFTRGMSQDDVTRCLEFARKKPKLEKLVFSTIPTNPVRFGCAFQAIRYRCAVVQMEDVREMLLHSNADRLKLLEIEHNDLENLLSNEEMLVFPTLRNLIVHTTSVVANDGNIFANTDLPLRFPRLERVELRLHHNSNVQGADPQSSAPVAGNRSIPSCKTVRSLIIQDVFPAPEDSFGGKMHAPPIPKTVEALPKIPTTNQKSAVDGLDEMFPNLSYLKIETKETDRLYATVSRLPSFPNLEAFEYSLHGIEDGATVTKILEEISQNLNTIQFRRAITKTSGVYRFWGHKTS